MDTTFTQRDRDDLIEVIRPLKRALEAASVSGEPTVEFLLERDRDGYNLTIASAQLAALKRFLEVLQRPQVVGL